MRDRAPGLLRHLFDAAVATVMPSSCVPADLPAPPPGRTVILGAGKSSAAMARAVESSWPSSPEGLVVTRDGHLMPTASIEVVEASHPLPDQRSVEAAHRMLQLAHGLGPADLALCLLSGGGSALLVGVPDAVPFSDLRRLGRNLLAAGMPIGELNIVRKHVSTITGGRLARVCAPARVVTLAISDVPGDDPATIASGPTVGDPSTRHDALGILERRDVRTPPSILAWLRDPSSESPKPETVAGSFRIVASARHALQAAADAAEELGLRPTVVDERLEGPFTSVAATLARAALEVRAALAPSDTPVVLLAGGEATVRVRGDGRGGPNTATALAFALALDGEDGIWALVADTDGIDGTGPGAGAIVGPDTLDRARRLGLDPEAALRDDDSMSCLDAAGAVVTTGPTFTNVADFRAVLVLPPGTEAPRFAPD